MKYIATILFLFQICSTSAQSLDEYQWRNRLIIILANSEKDKRCQLQLKDLKTDLKGMEERKFVVIILTPNYQITGINSKIKHQSGISYKDLATKREDFELLLIGLDGGVKFRQNEPVSHRELFSQVDQMPMRRQEMEKR